MPTTITAKLFVFDDPDGMCCLAIRHQTNGGWFMYSDVPFETCTQHITNALHLSGGLRLSLMSHTDLSDDQCVRFIRRIMHEYQNKSNGRIVAHTFHIP